MYESQIKERFDRSACGVLPLARSHHRRFDARGKGLDSLVVVVRDQLHILQTHTRSVLYARVLAISMQHANMHRTLCMNV